MKKKKVVACLFLLLIFINIMNPLKKVEAAVNTKYGELVVGDYGEITIGSTLLSWIGEIAYTLASGIESIGRRLMKIFTGVSVFPYSDKIIFNTIPILDVNFINPASGSLFEKTDGTPTEIGNIIRKLYFTVLSICLSFLTLVLGIACIRLAISTIASEKAKYKEAISNFLTCLVLLFGLHYLLSFTFFLNEKLVETASFMLNDVLATMGSEQAAQMSAQADELNEAIAKNFTTVASEECFISKIPIVGDIYQGVLNCLHALGNLCKKVWKFITGQKDKQDEISIEQLGQMYPKKEDYVDYILENDTRINVAAYLLKNKYYRETYLQWVKGNDTNSFNSSGIAGVGRNILIGINDVFGVADNGYKALRMIFTSVATITYKPGVKDIDGNDTGAPFQSVMMEGNLGTDGNVEYEYEEEETYKEDGQTKTRTVKKKGTVDPHENDQISGEYYYKYITSTDAYLKYVDDIDANIEKAQTRIDEINTKENPSSAEKKEREQKEGEVLAMSLDRLYASAYYKYVYDGTDKVEPKSSDLISELGSYFKETSWYVDTENKGWSPTAVNVLSAICYAIFVLQSVMFLFAYFKRFFYVVILSLLGPVVVVFDYMAKSV